MSNQKIDPKKFAEEVNKATITAEKAGKAFKAMAVAMHRAHKKLMRTDPLYAAAYTLRKRRIEAPWWKTLWWDITETGPCIQTLEAWRKEMKRRED